MSPIQRCGNTSSDLFFFKDVFIEAYTYFLRYMIPLELKSLSICYFHIHFQSTTTIEEIYDVSAILVKTDS